MIMKVKKIFLLIFFLGIMIPGMFAAEKWLDKDAEYCVSFTLPRKGAPGFWQVDNYAFPFNLKDGFTVWDEAGKKYNFFFNLRTRQLILAAAKKDNAKIYIYPSKKSLQKILKNRHYYVADRFIRNWHWRNDQPASQAVNISILSYGPDPKAKEKAIAKAKVEAEAALEAAAIAKARVKVRADIAKRKAKRKAIVKAKADAKARVIAKARAKAEAKAIAEARGKVKALAEAKARAEVKARTIDKLRTEAEAKTKVKTKTKAEAKTKVKTKTKAEAKNKAEASAIAKVRAEAKSKAMVKARAKAKAKARADAIAKRKARADAIAKRKARADAIAKRKARTKANKKNVKKNLKRKPKKRKPRPKKLPRIGHLPAKDFPVDTAELKKIFKYKRQQYVYRRNYRDTNIIRPIYWRIKGKYAAYIDAKLNVPHPGEYQFAVKSNNMTELYVNGKQVLKINKKKASTDKWRETKLFDLYVNPVKIEAYYCSTVDKTSIVIGWRAKGEKNYKFISQKGFVGFNKVEPENLTSSKGQKLPVIKYNTMGYFQNNGGKQFLLGFETNFPGNKIAWQINGKTVDSGKKIMMTFANKIPENISCVVNDSNPFKVIIPHGDLKNPGDLLERDLYVKVNAPTFLYDDETLDLSAEFHSELQIDIKAFIEAKSNSDVFKKFRFSHAFNKTSNEPLFRTHDFVKKYFKLEGAKLKNGAELEFSIETSADDLKTEDGKFYFDRRKIIFKKLSECSDLNTENGYFIDSKANRIIPILHRPTLDDKRSWSLLNSLPTILGGQSILIISDDFGGKTKLSTELLKNAESGNQKLVFENWNLKAFDADFVNESAKKIKLIRNAQSAVLIIVPSTYPIMRGVAPRLQQRLLAALIQTARNNKNIRKIILTTPFPLEKPFAENENIETIFKNIQHLVTEQEIGFMSLPEISSEEETILTSTHPATKTKEYADIIIKPKRK
jgi:PA14 domain